MKMVLFINVLCIITSQVTKATTACGVFNFDSPKVDNGTLVVKESARVNITFTIVTTNCSNETYGDVVISKYDTSVDIFMPQCKIFNTCVDLLPDSNIYCHCLDSPGVYRSSFVASRKHSALWKWTMKSVAVQNEFLRINVTYPSRITQVEIVGYDKYIPRHKSVTLVCSWENGFPPTTVSLLDRNNRLLEKGDTSGNISHTFPQVECNRAGVYHCESSGSEKNMSTNMLIECPPEFVKSPSNIQHIIIGTNGTVSFPFRSYTPNISSCSINQMIHHTTVSTNHFITAFFNCSKVENDEINFNMEIKHCLYFVTGEPPDLQLTVLVRNLKREDGGLWYVMVSNDEGSDMIYIHVSIAVGDDRMEDEIKTKMESSHSTILSSFAIVGVILGVSLVSGVVAVSFRQGRDVYPRLIRKLKGTVLYRGLGTHTLDHSLRQSEIYDEIQETQVEKEIQPSGQEDFLSAASSHELVRHEHLLTTNDVIGKNKCSFQNALEEMSTSISSENSSLIKNLEPSCQHTLEHQNVHSENETNNVPQTLNSTTFVEDGNKIIKAQPILQYLKIVPIGSKTNHVTQI